jgi:hypothetical protein
VCVTPDKNHSLSLSLRALTAETSGIPGIQRQTFFITFPSSNSFPLTTRVFKKAKRLTPGTTEIGQKHGVFADF